mgnify:CR=1 FL=1
MWLFTIIQLAKCKINCALPYFNKHLTVCVGIVFDRLHLEEIITTHEKYIVVRVKTMKLLTVSNIKALLRVFFRTQKVKIMKAF